MPKPGDGTKRGRGLHGTGHMRRSERDKVMGQWWELEGESLEKLEDGQMKDPYQAAKEGQG